MIATWAYCQIYNGIVKMLGATWVFLVVGVLSLVAIGVAIFLALRYRSAKLRCQSSEGVSCPEFVCPNGNPAV